MAASASTGDNTEGPAEVGDCARRVSDRKARANVENARRSTGPRTEAGKRASSMNALKHGGYARASVAIPRGRFAEDPEEVQRRVDDVVESLLPRDRLEYDHAVRLAMCYLRFDRMDLFEAETLGRPYREVHDPIVPRGGTLDECLVGEQAVLDFLTGDADEVNYEQALEVILRSLSFYASNPEMIQEPEAHQAWPANARVVWLLTNCSSPGLEALKWQSRKVVANIQEKIDKRDIGRARVAEQAAAVVDKNSVTTQRITRQLNQLHKDYTAMQKRPLSSVGSLAPRNEPTEPDAGRPAGTAGTGDVAAIKTTHHKRHLAPAPRNEPTESDAGHPAGSADTAGTGDVAHNKTTHHEGHLAPAARYEPTERDAGRPAGSADTGRTGDSAPNPTFSAYRRARPAPDQDTSPPLGAPLPVDPAHFVDQAHFVVDRTGIVSDERLADRARRLLLPDRAAVPLVDQSLTGYDESLLSDRLRRYFGKPPGA